VTGHKLDLRLTQVPHRRHLAERFEADAYIGMFRAAGRADVAATGS
jgi:hypothetical protein